MPAIAAAGGWRVYIVETKSGKVRARPSRRGALSVPKPRRPRHHRFDRRADAAPRPVPSRLHQLYTGITVDVRRRLEQHAGARAGGAKALRGDPPARLRYVERAADRAEASRREFELKRMRADEKRALLAAAAAANGGEALNDAELAALDPLRGDGDDAAAAKKEEKEDGEEKTSHRCAFFKEYVDE